MNLFLFWSNLIRSRPSFCSASWKKLCSCVFKISIDHLFEVWENKLLFWKKVISMEFLSSFLRRFLLSVFSDKKILKINVDIFYIWCLVFLRAKGLIIVIIFPFFAGSFQRVWRNCWSISGIREPSFLCNRPPNMMVRIAYKNVWQYQKGSVVYVFMWNLTKLHWNVKETCKYQCSEMRKRVSVK